MPTLYTSKLDSHALPASATLRLGDVCRGLQPAMSTLTFTFSFPWDIERLIFEEAATDDIRTALQLALIARYVQSWYVDYELVHNDPCAQTKHSFDRIEPIVYKIVTLNYEAKEVAFLQSLIITTKPRFFYTRCVKTLYLAWRLKGDFDTILPILRNCQGVTNLVCWAQLEYPDPRVTDVVAALRPQKLRISLINLLGTRQPDLSHPFFGSITHLNLLDLYEEWITWSGIHLLPCLSHLVLRMDGRSEPPETTVMRITTELLSQCKTLQVCVFRVVKKFYRPIYSKLECIEDDRVVVMFEEECPKLDWYAFQTGPGTCTWARAEAKLEKQKQDRRSVKPF